MADTGPTQTGSSRDDTSPPAVPQSGSVDATQERRGFAAWEQWKARELLGVGIVLVAIYTIHGFLGSLAWGLVFAVATWPLYRQLRTRWPRLARGPLLPMLCTAAMALLFLIPMGVVALEAANEAQSLLLLIKNAKHDGIPLPQWVQHLPFGSATASTWWQSHLADPEAASQFLNSFDNHGLEMTRTVGSQLAHRGMLFFFSILTLFFLYKDGDKVIRQCTLASRRAFGRRGERIGQQIVASIHGTVAGLVLVGVGEGFLMGGIYLFAGAPHPALLGVGTAIAAMIPFCAMIPVVLASVLLMIMGDTLGALVVLGIGAVVIFVADHFVRPGLIGGTTKLPFLWVLLGIVGGAETWGLLGLFIGPAAMATLHLLWQNWTRERGMRLAD